MPQYRIYAGLSGGFGGAVYQYTEEFDNEAQATNAAYEEACQMYESQSGFGMEGWDDFIEEAKGEISRDECDSDEEYEDALDQYAAEAENEARESWIEYNAILVGSEEDTDEIDD